jgi:hypothetical protein
MMKKILFLFFSLSAYSLFCQTLTPEGTFAAGDYYSNGFAQISWTLGDTQTNTFQENSTGLTLTQGFLQSQYITGIYQVIDNKDFKLEIYPNPVHDILDVKLTTDKEAYLFLEVYSIDGKKVYMEKIYTSSKLARINFSNFQRGLYILNVLSDERTIIKSFKILFQD